MAEKEKYIMALDQGTTSSRAIIFNKKGEIVAKAQNEFAQHYPENGWVEHDPMEILFSQTSAMLTCLRLEKVDPKDIVGIGITNQRETTIVWEKETGKPVYNAIVWQCRRTAPICEELKAEGLSDYVKETKGHVLYRVTPVFYQDELVARGVEMEGWSVEDNGESVCFNVFVYNVQPGISICYADGTSSRIAQEETTDPSAQKIYGNRRSKIYHCPGQAAYEEMKDSPNLVIFDSEAQAQTAGYRKAAR